MKKIFNSPSTVIALRYALIALIITLILMVIIPRVLNYGPGSINTPFDIQMSYISYNTQFLIIVFAIVFIIVIFTKILLRDIDKWYLIPEEEKYSDLEKIKKIRKKCFNLPYFFFAFELLVPSTVAFFILSITGGHSAIMIFKVVALVLSFASLLAVASFIFSKNLYDEILSKTYVEGFDIGIKISMKQNLLLVVFPTFLSGILLTALIGYSSSVIEKEEMFYNTYNRILVENFDTQKQYTKNEINELVDDVDLYNEKDTIFLLHNDKTVEVLKGDKNVSYFVKEYITQLSDQYAGRVYDGYGVDTQGASIKVNINNENCYLVILYDIVSSTALNYLGIVGLFSFCITAIIISIYGNYLSKRLNEIYKSFRNICNNTDKSTLLPIISNDEIGNLVMAFNDIQKLNTSHIKDIQNKQNMLIERERLASLGQMVGGIAHSLKTPIFSISGGIEGLIDLVDEFDDSIEDPEVNDQDMHEIAKDMKVWLGKIRTQLTYMSEVITAVKGQAVSLSGDDTVKFTIEELFSHISVLMKHELQTALVTLNVENKVSNSVILKGNINNLVQVLNNLISNAIQAYNGQKDKSIDLKARLENNNILISIKDYGPGLPNIVKDKIFKEMITTKGKEGTGLGIFMSYSMIKAKFNGDMKYETSKKGTEFTIYLPLNNTQESY